MALSFSMASQIPQRDNICQSELAELKKLAGIILEMDWESLGKGIEGGQFFEIGVGDADI